MSFKRFLAHASPGAVAFAMLIAPAHAQTPVATAPASAQGRTFTPADFARFAPKTAFDMLAQVPGFSIRSGDNGERGLGQAKENVLINGQRVADKSGGAVSQLRDIPASQVERIEIVDAARLGVGGLSGEVANVILKAAKKSSGQFEWRPQVRAHYAHPLLFGGKISYNGAKGPVDYTLSIQNQSNRGAFGGPAVLSDANGVVFERRHLVLTSDSDLLTFKTRFKVDMPGSSVANLSLAYTPYWGRDRTDERRERTDGDDRDRLNRGSVTGYYYDINADYEFAAGPGRLKLIGLRHFDHEPQDNMQRSHYDSGVPDDGVRFERDSRISESIGRAEYSFKSGKSDWQLTLERADNRLDQRGKLSLLDPSGVFVPQYYPEGSGIVAETRYEGTATLSRALSPKLDLQVVGGGEVSKLERVDGDLKPRKFFRPKGSVSLGWKPAKDWDASFKLSRKVGQISFYDFLSQPNLQQDRENAGNPDLVPPQSWQAEVEAGRALGAWGKTRLKVYAHRIDDIVDIIPVGVDGEAIGNLPRATRAGIVSTSTINFDPIGWHGAKLDSSISLERSRVKDPLTGEKRPISGAQRYNYDFALRHDIPHSNIAWGAEFEGGRGYNDYFLTQISNGWEGPYLSVFVEHKDIAGLDVRAGVFNLNNGRHYYNRTAYFGYRDTTPVKFQERQNELIGPIFSLSVKGNF